MHRKTHAHALGSGLKRRGFYLLALVGLSLSAAAVVAPSIVAVAATSQQATASSPPAPPGQGDRTRPTPPPGPNVPHTDPASGASGLVPASPGPNQLYYGGGWTLHGFTQVALIFWGPNWNGDGRMGTVQTMFSHVGNSPWADTLLQYYDNSTSVDDTSAMYAGAWFDPGSAPPATYTQSDLGNEVTRALQLGAVPYSTNTVYLVYPNNGAINDQPNACGYHAYTPYAGQYVAIATVDYNHCNFSVSGATGDAITQGLTKVGLHELAEAVTDPYLNAWGANCSTCEIGDLCNGNLIAVSFGGVAYAGQQIWGNHEGTCLSSTSVTYSYKWVSQTYTPNPMIPRDAYSVQLVVQNTGNVQWPVRSILHLGTDSPQDRCSAYSDGSWIGCTRVGGMYNQINSNYSTVQPGQNAVFTFDLYANPSRACTTSNEHFNLVMESRLWFASAGIYWPITLGCYNGSFNSETPPTALVTGDDPETNAVKIRFTNIGNVPWYNDGQTVLSAVNGCSMFYDSLTWINCSVVTSHIVNASNSSKSWVDPGEVGEFDFTLNVPATTLPGSYSQEWVLINQGAQVMGGSYHWSTYTVVA